MFKLNHLAAVIALSSSFSLYAAEAYDRSKSYSSGSQVSYNGNIYEAQWWANPNDTPATVTENAWESPWILISEGVEATVVHREIPTVRMTTIKEKQRHPPSLILNQK